MSSQFRCSNSNCGKILPLAVHYCAYCGTLLESRSSDLESNKQIGGPTLAPAAAMQGLATSLNAPLGASTQALTVGTPPVTSVLVRSKKPIALMTGVFVLLVLSGGIIWSMRSVTPPTFPPSGTADQTTATPSAVSGTKPPEPTEIPSTNTIEVVAPTNTIEVPPTNTLLVVAPTHTAIAIIPTDTPLPIQGPQFGPVQVLVPRFVSASSSAPDSFDSKGNVTSFTPANALDGRMDTAWRVPGNGINQFLLLEFSNPVRVTAIALVPGYAKVDPSDSTNRFLQNRRIQRVRYEFSDGSNVEATFTDTPSMQLVNVQPVVTTSIRIVILQTSEPGTSDPRDFTAISEVSTSGQEMLP